MLPHGAPARTALRCSSRSFQPCSCGPAGRSPRATTTYSRPSSPTNASVSHCRRKMAPSERRAPHDHRTFLSGAPSNWNNFAIVIIGVAILVLRSGGAGTSSRDGTGRHGELPPGRGGVRYDSAPAPRKESRPRSSVGRGPGCSLKGSRRLRNTLSSLTGAWIRT